MQSGGDCIVLFGGKGAKPELIDFASFGPNSCSPRDSLLPPIVSQVWMLAVTNTLLKSPLLMGHKGAHLGDPGEKTASFRGGEEELGAAGAANKDLQKQRERNYFTLKLQEKKNLRQRSSPNALIQINLPLSGRTLGLVCNLQIFSEPPEPFLFH